MATISEFAKDMLGVKLYDGQAEALENYYASRRPNWLLLAGRRGGKSLLSDVIACYESIVPDFGDILRPGEQRFVIITSTRLDNASLHITNIRHLLRHKFKKMIVSESKDRLELSNGVVILSLPASARSGRGYTASCVIFDELAHFIDSQGNQSADSVFDAFSPVVATFGDLGRLVITTTPMARIGIVYDLYDRVNKAELDDWFITHKTSQELNPKVSDRAVKRAYNRDPLSAATEYGAEFADPIAAYLDGEAINNAIDRHRKPAIKGDPAQTYAMAIDPATQSDRYAFLVAHKDGLRVIVDYAHIMRPPVDPVAAEDLLKDLVRRFKPVNIRCDTASTVERLKRDIYQLEYCPFTRPKKLQWYGSLKEALNLGNLSLLDHDDLLDELRNLQISNGVDIHAPKAGRVTHDDLADCLALVCDRLIAQDSGKAEMIANPFDPDIWPPPDGWVYNTVDGWHEPFNQRPHPPGVTWRNCRYRNHPGCEACRAELEAEGELNKPEILVGTTEEEYNQFRYNLYYPYIPQSGDEIMGKRIYNHLQIMARKKMTKGDHHV